MKKVIITVAATAIVVWGCTKKNNSTPRFCQMCTMTNWKVKNGVKVEDPGMTVQVCGIDTIEIFKQLNSYDSGEVIQQSDGSYVTATGNRTTTCK